jgi:hypothetical protein
MGWEQSASGRVKAWGPEFKLQYHKTNKQANKQKFLFFQTSNTFHPLTELLILFIFFFSTAFEIVFEHCLQEAATSGFDNCFLYVQVSARAASVGSFLAWLVISFS